MNKCLLCGVGSLLNIPSPEHLVGVTSDCKPWPRAGSFAACGFCGHVQKRLNNQWFSDVRRLYDQYEMYHLSGGGEQAVFASSTPMPRTSRLLARFREAVKISEEGRLLDIGCGNGAFLRTFGQLCPKWRLFGFEQSDASRNEVLEIVGVEDFYYGSLDEVEGNFDIISMLYVIEHLPAPVDVMKKVHDLIEPGGAFLIQTSYFPENPFDMVVVDHCSHFHLDTLMYAAGLAGFEPMIKTNDWVVKEIGLVVTPREDNTLDISFDRSRELSKAAENIVSWLQTAANHALKVAERVALGVFGTAVAGTWLANVLGDKVSFFVDEDPLRQGKTHMGIPVLKPTDVSEGSSVYLAFPPQLAEKLYRRLRSSYPSIRFVKPPRSSVQLKNG